MKRLACIALVVALAACSKKKEDTGAGMASGSAMVAPGSAAAGSATAPDTGSGSAGSATAAAGSGSAAGSAMAAGSGSDAGSAAAGSAAGSGSAVAAGSGSGGGSGSAEGGSAFDKLTHQEKMDFMKAKVVPPMKEAFQKLDGKKFANFGCKTCHGKDPKATKYKMPNPELPKLDFAKLKDGKQEPKTAEFMGKVVKPEMAKILGDHEFDMAHPEAGGFGCLECHLQKK